MYRQKKSIFLNLKKYWKRKKTFWTNKTGWTVTLAGTYCDDMAPDVQMHLSFPKRSSSQSTKSNNSNYLRQTVEESEKQQENNGNYEDEADSIVTEQQQEVQRKAAILPPPSPIPIRLNPKRTLTKNCYGPGTINHIFFADITNR